MMRKKFPNLVKNGQSLFEVVFSVAIAAILLTGVVALAATSIRNSTASRDTSLANKYVEEATEWLREERDKNWDTFRSHTATSLNWCLKAEPLSWSSPTSSSVCGSTDYIGSTLFIRKATFTCFNINPPAINCSLPSVNNIDTKVAVSWTDSQGVHEVSAIMRLTNWRK